MWDLSSDVNNTPKILKVSKTRATIYIGNTIEYDMKSYQFKRTIVKYTKVLLKGLKFDHSQKEMLVSPTIIWCNKTNLNTKQ